MTPAQRRACLDRLGVNYAWLARMVGYTRPAARAWCLDEYGRDAPASVDTWLSRMAAAIARHPPPRLPRRRRGLKLPRQTIRPT